LSGNIITLKYVSDGLGSDEDTKVHKFAEEAIYKHIALYMLSSTKANAQEYVVNRFKKERKAAMRNAKLRLQGTLEPAELHPDQ
jgi:CobQ-like glutamine amidotransferase family enzyme